MGVFWKLHSFFRKEWRAYALALVCLALVAGLLMIPPALIGDIIDLITQGNLTSQQLGQVVMQLTGLALLIYVLRVLWRIFLFGASHRLAADTRKSLFQHWLLLSPHYFQQHPIGDLMAHATSDVEALQMTAGEGILAAFDGLLTGLIVLIVMVATISWQLTLAALLPWPFAAIAMYWVGKKLHNSFSEAQSSFSALTDTGQESISGVRTIKSYGLEPEMRARFADQASRSSQAYYQVATVEALYTPIISFTIGLSFLLAVAYGGWLITHDQLTLGELTSFTMYLGYLIWPMFAFGWMLNIAERGNAALIRIQKLLNHSPEIIDEGKRPLHGSPDLKVAIDSFRYGHYQSEKEQGAPALSNIQFDLSAGSILGITGPTGSGKSTLIKVIQRHYELSEGSVHWGGIPIRSIPLRQLRDAVAYVPQEPFLFSISVRENLALGNVQATEEDMREALEIADFARDLQNFPLGLDTPVGERGVTLSGGQKQRLALARALLQNAPVLILDDALSAVDTNTEFNILKALRHKAERMRIASATRQSLVIISHRLSALQHADKVIVLTEGEVTQQGTHLQLTQEDGWYRQIYQLQQIETRLDKTN